MVLLHRRDDAAHHQHGLVFVGSSIFTVWKRRVSAGILLDVLLVLGPGRGADRAQRAARERRLQQVGRIAGAGRAARADQRVHLVDEQHDRLRRGLHFVDHLAQPLLELALHAGAGLQQADIQRPQRHVLQGRRHIAGGDAPREAFDDRGLTDARLAREDRVVLPAAHEDVDDLADLVVAADDRIDLALPRLLGEIDGEALQRLLLAQLRGRHRAAGLARRGLLPELRAVAGARARLPASRRRSSRNHPRAGRP